MKSTILSLLDSTFFVLSTFYSGLFNFNSNSIVENENFTEKFTTEEDKKLLFDTVRNLKETGETDKEIVLSNNKRITIVID